MMINCNVFSTSLLNSELKLLGCTYRADQGNNWSASFACFERLFAFFSFSFFATDSPKLLRTDRGNVIFPARCLLLSPTARNSAFFIYRSDLGRVSDVRRPPQSEICTFLLRCLFVLRWPCAVGRTLKSSYKERSYFALPCSISFDLPQFSSYTERRVSLTITQPVTYDDLWYTLITSSRLTEC